MVRGTWVRNLGFTGTEGVLWLLDTTLHYNPLFLYDEKPVLVHLPILTQFGPFTPWYGGPGYQIRFRVEISHHDGSFVLCIENVAFVTN